MYKQECKKKMYLSTKLFFGKYKGELIYDIIKVDPTYCEWLTGIWEGEIDNKVMLMLKDNLKRMQNYKFTTEY